MDLHNLIIETTRRCNMKCDHCLRGPAQDIAMTQEVITPFFRDVDSIDVLTFTGGEPSLPSGVMAMNLILDTIVDKSIMIQSFFIATNGKRWSNAFVKFIYRIYSYCEENDTSGIKISGDQFHSTHRNERNEFQDRLYSTLQYDYDIENLNIWTDNTLMSDNRILYMGNAIGNGIGQQPINTRDFRVGMFEDQIQVRGDVYLSSDGHVINHCDYSYDDIAYDEDALICKVADFTNENMRRRAK